MASPTESEDLLFSGLKVVDCGTWIAGPVAGTILADFGASVIKVEVPGAGDPFRALSNGPLTCRTCRDGGRTSSWASCC